MRCRKRAIDDKRRHAAGNRQYIFFWRKKNYEKRRSDFHHLTRRSLWRHHEYVWCTSGGCASPTHVTPANAPHDWTSAAQTANRPGYNLSRLARRPALVTSPRPPKCRHFAPPPLSAVKKPPHNARHAWYCIMSNHVKSPSPVSPHLPTADGGPKATTSVAPSAQVRLLVPQVHWR